MTTQTIKVFIHKSKHSDSLFASMSDMSDDWYLLVGEHEFDYTLPADFNPVAAEVAALEKQLTDLNDKHMNQVKAIKDRIKDLQCIAYSPAEQA